MCNMDKCNKFNQTNKIYKSRKQESGTDILENGPGLKSSLSIDVPSRIVRDKRSQGVEEASISSNGTCSRLAKIVDNRSDVIKSVQQYYTNSKMVPPSHISYMDKGKSKNQDLDNEYFLYDVTRHQLTRYDKNIFKKLVDQYSNNSHYKIKFIKIEPHGRIAIVQPLTWKPQGFFGDFCSNISLFWNIAQTLNKVVAEKVPATLAMIYDPHFLPWIADVMSMVSEIVLTRNLSIASFILFLTRLYSIISRAQTFKDTYFKPQSFLFTTIPEAIMALATIGLPSNIINMLKNFHALSGKRLQDTNIFMESITFLINFLHETLIWINNFNLINIQFIIDVVKSLLNKINHYNMIKEIAELVTSYNKNSQIMLDISFRERVMQYETKIKDAEFREYALNSNNRYTMNLVNCFEQNIIKYAKTFDASSKDEPICIVFEGKAGCGKSVMMNALVDLLRANNRSVYVHSTPCIEAGKDFYDDYENQEVFVMDDVGQQGVSQWRHIINFVSPVKYPLECAAAEKKNTKFFNSKIILCTTNKLKDLPFTTSCGISEPEALYRRIHLIRMTAEGDKRKYVYEKFDHTGTKTWRNELIGVWKDLKHIPVEFSYSLETMIDAKFELFKLVETFLHKQVLIKEAVSTDEETIRVILNKFNKNKDYWLQGITYETGSENVTMETTSDIEWSSNNKSYFKEFVAYLIQSLKIFINETIPNYISNLVVTFQAYMAKVEVSAAIKVIIQRCVIIFITTACTSLVSYLVAAIISYLKDKKQNAFNDTAEAVATWEKVDTILRRAPKPWYFQSLTTHMSAVQSSFRIVTVNSTIIKSGKEYPMSMTVQALVSGDKIILPHHAVGRCGKVTATVYKNREGFKRNCIELDNIELEEVRRWSEIDTCIFRFKNISIPIYKLAKAAMSSTPTINHAGLSLVNADQFISMDNLGHYKYNTERISVRLYDNSEVVHEPRQGLEYSEFTAEGLCGTMVYAHEGGIVGMHVAGTSNAGFSVLFPKQHLAEIQKIMLETREAPMQPADDIYDDFSGMRYRYEKNEITPTRAIKETNFVKTPLHASTNPDMENLMKVHQCRYKQPPNFSSHGTPSKTMSQLAKKSFKPLGKVDAKELNYAKKVISMYIPSFKEISLEETIFGNSELKGMKLDTSNGYGWDLSKEELFDKKTRTISKEFLDRYEKFIEDANNNRIKIQDVLSRESFKDELRLEHKVDKPRTFRVMPLHHIVATKQLFAEVLIHVRKHFDENGVAIGINPYTDWDKIYAKLSEMKIVFDNDVENWDGGLHCELQDALNDVMRLKYTGSQKLLLDVILNTIVRGYVLVIDAIFMTTHSMPSGTWVTALFNSLINKMISAMSYYRYFVKLHGYEPTPESFKTLLDMAMGDDKLCGAPDTQKEYFNALAVRDVTADMGMKCTDGLKNPIVGPSIPLTQVSFLKRKFKYHFQLGKHVGPLDLETLLNTIQWVDSSKDYEEVMVGKAIAVQTEAYLHSPEMRDQLYHIMKKVIPSIPYMNDDRIHKIMTSPDGYVETMKLLGKDFLY